LWPIDAWIAGPFHALGILDPKLAVTGYGVYRNASAPAWLKMAATLDVLRGRTRAAPYPFPVKFPGDGSVVPYPTGCVGGACYGGGEAPDPLSPCPGYSVPTGLPIILQLGTGSVTPSVSASSLMQDGFPLQHCVYTETTYTNPLASEQSTGRAVLGSRDAVVLVPRSPLPAGATYTVSLTVNGTSYQWSFTVIESGTPSGTSGPPADTDADGLPDSWESQFGLNPNSATGADGTTGDPDGDGASNAAELAAGTHPRGTFARYLAEGATTIFVTRIALLNPGAGDAHVNLRFLRSGFAPISRPLTIPPLKRATVDVGTIPGMGSTEFSTVVESDALIVVDRTMTWDKTSGYGAHAETAITSPALTWYLAEGATHGGFDLFYLLQNPNSAPAEVLVRFLRGVGAPLEKTYVLEPNSRTNIWVDLEEFPAGSGNRALAQADVSAVLQVQNGQPIIVERAMYAQVPGQTLGAGHESAGITAPALGWFLAEGATGPYFDLFVLIANPGDSVADIEAKFLLPDGSTIVKRYTVAANSRFNIWVDGADDLLADTAVSTTIQSTNGVPVIVERAMWWPGSAWYEAHNSPGSTETGTAWALAEGQQGGATAADTYILVANTGAASGVARVTLLFEDQSPPISRDFTLAPYSRTNVPVGSAFPGAAGRVFGATVESLGDVPAPIVVERAIYYDANGVRWAAGTNALATKLR
jgi:hypothetical protein